MMSQIMKTVNQHITKMKYIFTAKKEETMNCCILFRFWTCAECRGWDSAKDYECDDAQEKRWRIRQMKLKKNSRERNKVAISGLRQF